MTLARMVASKCDMPDLRMIEVEHPLGARTEAEVRAMAAGIVDEVVALLTEYPTAESSTG